MATAYSPVRSRAVGSGRGISGLAEAVSVANLSRGTRLFDRGDPADRLYVLSDGEVKLEAVGPGGKHCLFHVVEPGEVFGEEALLGEQQRSYAAEVLEPATVTIVPAAAASRYADQHPEFWASLAPQMRRRMLDLEEQIQWVSFWDVEQRIARLILRWADSHEGTNGTAEMHLSQRDLAGMIGATRETTSSALNRLQRDGVIEIKRRRVLLRSVEQLRLRAEGGDGALARGKGAGD